MTYLPLNLKYLRTKNNHLQDDLASKFFVSHQTISNHETGKSEPSLDMIRKYAEFYNVDFLSLIYTDLSKNKTSSKIIFDSVIFDKKDRSISIINGTKGTYYCRNIKKCTVLNENSTHHKKTEPFKHQVLNGGIGMSLFEPTLYVGLKLSMKDGSTLAIYTSDSAIYVNTDNYQKDRKEAHKIKHLIDHFLKEEVL